MNEFVLYLMIKFLNTIRNTSDDIRDDLVEDLADYLEEIETRYADLLTTIQGSFTDMGTQLDKYKYGAVDSSGTVYLDDYQTVGNVITTPTVTWQKIVGVAPTAGARNRFETASIEMILPTTATFNISQVALYLGITADTFTVANPLTFGSIPFVIPIHPCQQDCGSGGFLNIFPQPGLQPTSYLISGSTSPYTSNYVTKEGVIKIPLGGVRKQTEGIAVWAWLNQAGCTVKGALQYAAPAPYSNTGV